MVLRVFWWVFTSDSCLRPFERRRFFEGLGGCRRRGAAGGWEQQPVAEVLRPWLEFEPLGARGKARKAAHRAFWFMEEV